MAAAQISVAKITSGLEILSSLPQANLIYKWKDFFYSSMLQYIVFSKTD